MNSNQLYFPNGFEKTKVRLEKIKIKLAHNFENYEVVDFEREDEPEDDKWHLWKYSW